MNNKIGVFDSGIGGLTTLNEIMKLLPNENYIFYADSKNNPYGEKTFKDLYKTVTHIVDYLITRKVKIIVIACNTATTKCIEKLRNDYPNMIFVGTEPAVKVACDKGYKNTLVMATPGTIKSERLHKLIKANKKKDQHIYLLPCEGLANAIETHDEKLVDNLLKKYLTKYKNIDSVVLGCTHYPHIKNKVQKYFKDAEIIDGNIGVAKRVKSLLEENNILNDNFSIEFIQTKK